MKRILFLLMALLTGVSGAWATSTYFVGGRAAADHLQTGKKYMIYNTAYASNGTRQWFLGASGSGYALSRYTSTDLLSYSTTDANYVWELETGSTSGTYKIKNVGTSTYCAGGTSLGETSKDYTIADYSSCSSKGDGVTYSFEGATAISYDNVTSDYKAVYVQGASEDYWNGNSSEFTLGQKAHAYVFYEVVEIADGACYTIDFVSFDGTKTWGLSTSGTSASVSANATGSVFVAHSYTNAKGENRWIFVNNTDGYYLAYRAATATFDISNAINEWSIGNLTAGMNGYVSSSADGTNKLYITNDKRYTNNTSKGCYILNESTGAFDNTAAPYYNGTYTSAMKFTPNAASVSDAAALAIAKFDALYQVKDIVACASNMSALFGDPGTLVSDINAATTAASAASLAGTYMKSAEGKKFYMVNSTATGYYANLGTSQITATATKLNADAVMELEYAGEGKYYLKGSKSGYYASSPTSGSANPGTVSSSANATPLFVGNSANTTDNVVYFARTKTGGNNPEAIHYNSGYTAQGNVVAWAYDAGASQWNITAVSDERYEALSNVCDVTYNVILEASGTVKATSTESEAITSPLSIPTSIGRDFCTYTIYSDAACETPITTVPNETSATVYALATVTTPFTASSDYASATWYNMVLKNAYYPLYTSGNTPNVTLPTVPGTEANMEWAFIGNPYDGYQIINKGAGDGYELSSADDNQGTEGGGSYTAMAANGTQTYNRWFPKSSTYYTNGFYLYNSNNHALNQRSTDNLAYWTGGADGGSTFTVSSVTDNAAELTAKATALEALSYGSDYGEYTLTGDYAGYESQMSGIISGLKSSYTYTGLLNARALPTSMTLNVPRAGDFLRIKASDTNKAAYTNPTPSDLYLTSSNTQSEVNSSAYKNKRIEFSVGTATDNTTIFYFDGTYLTGFANGLQPINGDSQLKMGEAGATATSIAFESIESDENKAFRIEFKANERSLYTQRFGTVYYTDAAGANATDVHYRYFLERVTSLPVTISAAGYATFNCPVAVTIPEGVTAYQAYVRDEQYVNLVSIDDGVIPANFPVVLKGTPGTYNFPITTTELTSADYQSNQLQGSVAAMSVAVGDIYTLQRDSETTVGFYPNAGTTFKGFSAYLTSAGNSRGFQMVTPTGIEEVASPELHIENAYDLQGRRAGQVKKGVYIVNGKKVLF